METVPRLRLAPDVVQAITRRAAHGGLHAQAGHPNVWAQYELLLAACSEVLNQAPTSPQACEALDVEQRLGADLATIIEILQDLLPGGLFEAASYLPEEKRRQKFGRLIVW
jgi:hypothetical protein